MKHSRDAPRCVFCCPLAFEDACNTPLGKRNFTHKLKCWRGIASPVFEAAFTFGTVGLLLPPYAQQELRRKAGERPKFDNRSWLHKSPSRLEAYLWGKPILPEPPLTDAGMRFLLDCRSVKNKRSSKDFWVEKLRAHVRHYGRWRTFGPTASPCHRRKWWQLRRYLQKQLAPAVAAGVPHPPAIQWAVDEGILFVDCTDQH